MLRFSDGMNFDTSGGELRIIRRSDGLYVTGRNMLCPISSMAEGQKLIQDLNKEKCENCSSPLDSSGEFCTKRYCRNSAGFRE